ncbi:hypothetical protein [Streptomyces tsukubensis]|uniref:Uncharacterized protein n=1 Tax=Streptomyces tsukubensis TaxID=83656 RepID=A0A1V4A5N2_9ACTN|nr:hypothetical protein [Streptomyces tsukubensis]OON75974.1 hypothetical protein B1H18_21825 [Streptomyces tsukubensis]QFR94066.1 hypothetical protein GBW32_14610 [Streptomyces tsukubensis]
MARPKSVDKVHGTTGWIWQDNNGNVFDTAVHPMRLLPEWKEGDRISFDRVAWPEGREPPSTCPASRGG